MNMPDSPLGELNCILPLLSVPGGVCVCVYVCMCVHINAHLSVCMAIHSLVFAHWLVGTNVCAACVYVCVCLFLV